MMAKNDMETIVYKILEYVYECEKKGVEPDEKVLSPNGSIMNVPQSYHASIMEELINNG